MDSKSRLANVAFGGSWVEAILEREDMRAAVAAVDRAAADCMEEDARTPPLREALDTLAARIARGRILADAYWRALGLDPGRRQAEVDRVRAIILSAVGVADAE